MQSVDTKHLKQNSCHVSGIKWRDRIQLVFLVVASDFHKAPHTVLTCSLSPSALLICTLRQMWRKWGSSCSWTPTHLKVSQIFEVSRTFLQRKESHAFERIKTSSSSSDWFMLVVVCTLLSRLRCCALHKNHFICRYLEHFLLWNLRNIPQALYNLNSQLSTRGSLLGEKKNLLTAWQPAEQTGISFLWGTLLNSNSTKRSIQSIVWQPWGPNNWEGNMWPVMEAHSVVPILS